MVTGLGSLVNSDNSMMMKLISDISSLDAYQKATESKENGDNSSVEDIFSQIIDNINDNIEKNVAAEAGLTSSLGDTSNAQFGPPAGMEIDGLDTDSLNAIDSISDYGNINTGSSSESVANAQPSGGGGAGDGSENDKDSDDSNNPMDLNSDGTVTTQEMLAYYQMQNSAYNQDGGSNVIEEAIDLML